jgi:hypothetical protein
MAMKLSRVVMYIPRDTYKLVYIWYWAKLQGTMSKNKLLLELCYYIIIISISNPSIDAWENWQEKL